MTYSASNHCQTCNRSLYTQFDRDYHKCPPRFECWDECYDASNPDIHYSYDAETAATEFAEQQDTADGPYNGTVFVRSPDGVVTQWSITHDYSIDYYATETT